MGHARYGYMLDTKPWRKVVALIAGGSSVAAIADATMEAADRGLKLAFDDKGLSRAVYLLTQVALAARQDDFRAALNQAGILVQRDPGLTDLLAGVNEALDSHLSHVGRRTDIGEMAQMAAIESLTSLVDERSRGLFGRSPADVKDAVREFSAQTGFAALSHRFFANFTEKFLTYHLSRELSKHVGSGERFRSVEDHTSFLNDMQMHCRQAALVVWDYSGGWYSKANFEGGISPEKAKNFANYALKKMRDELRVRKERGAD